MQNATFETRLSLVKNIIAQTTILKRAIKK